MPKKSTEDGEISDTSSHDNRDQNNNKSIHYSFGNISYIESDKQFPSEKENRDVRAHEMSSCSILSKHQNNDDENMDLDAIISEGVHKEIKGAPLDAKSKEVVDNWFTQDCDSEYIKKLKERYAEPENVEHLSGKDMNPEVYRNLPEHIKQRDFWMKSVQTNISTSAVASFRALDLVLQNKQNMKPELVSTLCKHITSATKLIAKASSDITVIRKQHMRFHIHPKYRPLCNKRTYDKQLFGDNFAATLKETNESNKIVSNIRKERFHPYHNNQQRSRGFFTKPRKGNSPQSRKRLLPNQIPTASKLTANAVSPTTKERVQNQKPPTQVDRYDEFYSKLTKIQHQCKVNKEKFKAGQLKEHAKHWKTFTTDPWVLNSILRLEIKLKNKVHQSYLPKEIKFSLQE